MSGDGTAEQQSTARAYYDALDSHEYEQLETLLTADFVHIRPEMTLDGRDRFVQFMRTERPMTKTSHPIDEIYQSTAGDELAVRGRLVAQDGALITGFVDIFSFAAGSISKIRTYTD